MLYGKCVGGIHLDLAQQISDDHALVVIQDWLDQIHVTSTHVIDHSVPVYGMHGTIAIVSLAVPVQCRADLSRCALSILLGIGIGLGQSAIIC